jgi:hypothetical protein
MDTARRLLEAMIQRSRGASGYMSSRNPILDLPLSEVMRSEIALTLQHVLQIYTVGNFLKAWRNPKNHKSIEQVFDNPQQARHAAAVCAHWLGIRTQASASSVAGWWRADDFPTLPA